jgi:DNA-binding XRE family transcriptional regulator
LHVLQPKRPLHAYNIFFQQERQAILANLPEPKPDAEAATKEKRRRRATHGKISFASLAKEIGQKWQTLEKKEKERYQHLAEIDLKRYDDEMEAYNQQQKPAAKEKGNEQTKKSAEGNDADADIDSAGESSEESSTDHEVAKKRKVT